jgi:hypothetical protein
MKLRVVVVEIMEVLTRRDPLANSKSITCFLSLITKECSRILRDTPGSEMSKFESFSNFVAIGSASFYFQTASPFFLLRYCIWMNVSCTVTTYPASRVTPTACTLSVYASRLSTSNFPSLVAILIVNPLSYPTVTTFTLLFP